MDLKLQFGHCKVEVASFYSKHWRLPKFCAYVLLNMSKCLAFCCRCTSFPRCCSTAFESSKPTIIMLEVF